MDDLISKQATIEGLPSVQSEIDKRKLIRTITAGIVATNTNDVYSCGMRNGMRWCRSLLEEDAPKFEDASLYAQPERKRGKWIKEKGSLWTLATCSVCGELSVEGDKPFCPNCGAKMEGGD